MNNDRAIEIMKAEATCVRRQDTPQCHRYEHEGCLKCDLAQDTDEVLQAYAKAIWALEMASPTEVVKIGEPLSNSDEISKALEKGEIYKRGYEDAKKEYAIPTGEWIDTGDMQEYWAEEYQCSICGGKDHWHNYCPNCGAKMKGGDEE